MRRVLPFAAALLALAGLVYLFQTARRYEPGRQSPFSDEAGLGDVSIQFGKTIVIARTAGMRQWSFRADRIDFHNQTGGDFEQMRAATFNGIHSGILYKGGRKEASFSAGSASYDRFAERFDVRGGIHLHSRRGDDVTADQLVWSEREDFARFPAGAKGQFSGSRLTAPSLFYEPRRRIVQCPVGADVAFKDGSLTGHAAALFWDIRQQVVDMPGPVSGVRRGIRFLAANARLNMRTHDLSANNAEVLVRIRGEGPDLENLR